VPIPQNASEKVEEIIREVTERRHLSPGPIRWLDTVAGPDIKLQIVVESHAIVVVLNRGDIEYCPSDPHSEDAIRISVEQRLDKMLPAIPRQHE
jgi:hypothetical protein